MCGIAGVFDLKSDHNELRQVILKMSGKVRHRGPDWSGIYSCQSAILAHERLAIVDPQSGKQPFISRDGRLILAINGEIYNHREIRERYEGLFEFSTHSDCEVILPLYLEKGPDFLEELNGIFAFALYDRDQDSWLIARDHIGINPLYTGRDRSGNFFFASELKALEGVCTQIEEFLPGHYLYSRNGAPVKWYNREWNDYEAVRDNTSSVTELREALEAAVHRQLMSDVPYGVLLSGGLDSSVISAVARKFAPKRIESGDTGCRWLQLRPLPSGSGAA